MISVHSDEVDKVDSYIDQGKHVFILVYMEGCGPCMATKPEWLQIDDFLKDKYKNDNSIVIADIENDKLSKLKHVGEVDGFPTMKYMHKNNSGIVDVEPYEKADIKNANRSAKSFAEWIEQKSGPKNSRHGGNIRRGGNIRGGGNIKSSPYHLLRRLSKKTRKKRSKSKKRNKNRKKTRIKKRV